MHKYIVTRGIKKDVDDFITQLQGQYVPFQYQGKQTWLQTSVRPIQIWEIAFPKEHLDAYSNTFFDGQDPRGRNKKFQFVANQLRRIMGLKKIPFPYDAAKGRLALVKQNIEVIGIGIKEDEDIKTEGI